MEVSLHQSLGQVPGSTRKSASIENGDSSSGTPMTTRSQPGLREPDLRLAALQERLSGESAVDSARVARITGDVRAGNYRVDPQNTAEKMLGMELSLP